MRWHDTYDHGLSRPSQSDGKSSDGLIEQKWNIDDQKEKEKKKSVELNDRATRLQGKIRGNPARGAKELFSLTLGDRIVTAATPGTKLPAHLEEFSRNFPGGGDSQV